MNVYDFLATHNITFTRHDHVAVFTNDESEKLGIGEGRENTKNLFLADEKNRRFYLLTIQHGKRADLKKFAAEAGERRVHFANDEYLLKLLGLTPGSVTPMGLINDAENQVKFYLDEDLLKQEKIFVHPNINTATLELNISDFKKAVEATGHNINNIKI